MSELIAPGSALGVLGGGQLGRMFAIAARRLGYRVHVLVPEDDSPTSQVADHTVVAAYDDLDAVARFARGVRAVTFEFENVSAAAAETAAKFAHVRPGGHVLHTAQQRIREKTFLRNAGLPTPDFQPVRSLAELGDALKRIGTPAVLKTAAWGYDGKGQTIIRTADQAAEAWNLLRTDEAILEAFVRFEREVSVVAVRGVNGEFASYGPIDNAHRDHILDLSLCPAGVSDKVARDAVEIARTVMQKLEVVGVLCVEMFLKPDGSLLVNELAPRPHNSGHLTIDAHVSCQFEQQARAIAGLPLGSTRQLAPAAMANLLGDRWQDGEPNWSAVCGFSNVKLHLYGKREARRGRKMGHLTALGDSTRHAADRVLAAREAMQTR